MNRHKATVTCFCVAAFLLVSASASDLLGPAISPPAGLVRAPLLVTLTNPNSLGTIFYTTNGSDPADTLGKVSRSARSYSAPISLNKSTLLRARVKFGAAWSELATAPFTLDQDFSVLLFTEVMFHPANNSDREEFIELKNVGTEVLDLTGLTLVEGANETEYNPLYYFPRGAKIQPGSFYLLAWDPAVFQEFYRGVPLHGSLVQEMSNTDSSLSIRRGDALVTKARYESHAPWQVVPDNHGYFFNSTNEEVGFSLVRATLNPAANPTHFSNWRASTRRFGSPGADDPPPEVLPVYVNEVLARSSTFRDMVELYNPNSSDIDLGGWWLSDERNWPFRYKIPLDTRIPARGFLTLDDSTFGGGTNGFSFSAEGDRCYLFSGDPSGRLTGFSHGFHFGASDRDVSFGRVVGSDQMESFPPQRSLSFGTTNSGAKIGPLVISEVSYHPATGQSEFIELRNITSNPIGLWEPDRPQVTWGLGRFDGFYNYLWFSFPTNTTIPPNGMILLAEGDAGAFRTRHLVPAEVPIFPLPQKLGNGGEDIYLFRPSGLNAGQARYVEVDSLVYSDQLPWPPAADGGGQSLERVVLAGLGNDPGHWRANPAGISPGGDTATNLPPIAHAGGPRIAFRNRPIQLIGLVDDDLFPGRMVVSAWSLPGTQLQRRPPGGLTNVLTTTFSTVGLHRALFAASDSEFSAQDEIELEVIERPYERWVEQKFPAAQLQNISVVGENADPDADGLPNLQEYIFDLEPLVAGNVQPISIESGQGSFQLRWIQRATAPDVNVQVELAHRLAGPWFSGPGLFRMEEVVLPGGLTKAVTLTSGTSTANSPEQFIRLSLRAL